MYPMHQQQPHGYLPQQQQPHGYPSHQQQPSPPHPPPPVRAPLAPPAPPPPSAQASTYASQAARWKQGFRSTGASGGGSRQIDLEGALISELCSSVGTSSFPPRDVLQKLLRHLPSLDLEYLCELLNDKLDDRIWQVQAKAVSVLDTLMKSPDGHFFMEYYAASLVIFEPLRAAKKDILRGRAEKIYNILREIAPPAPQAQAPTPQQPPQMGYAPQPGYPPQPDYPPQSNYVPQPSQQPSQYLNQPPQQGNYRHQQYPPNAAPSPVYNGQVQGQYPVQQAQPIPEAQEKNLWGDDDQAEEVVPQAPSNQFPTQQAAPAPSPTPAPTASVSAFSFISASPSVPDQVQAPVTSTPTPVAMLGGYTPSDAQPPYSQNQSVGTFGVVVATHAPVVIPPTSVFDTLPPIAPTPITTASAPAPVSPKLEKQPSGDRIHDAFAGLSDDEDSSNLLDAYESSSGLSVKRSDSKPVEIVKGPVREVILEADLPPGPLGIILDRSISNMAVIERFVPMPSGEKGYLELHPAICPGCAMISINSIQLENMPLEEVGPILGAQFQNHKILRFKKLMCNGRTVNPSTMAVPYVPPPQEKPTSPPKSAPSSPKASSVCDSPRNQSTTDAVGGQFMNKLNELKQDLSAVEQKVQNIVSEQQKNVEIVDFKNQLAQLHGDVEKIQAHGIDSIILGPNPPPNHEEIKQYRSSLVKFAHELTSKIQRLALSEGQEVFQQPLSSMSSITASVAEVPSKVAVPTPAPTSGFGFIAPNTTLPQPTMSGTQQPLAISSPSSAGGVNATQASPNPSVPSPSQGSGTSTSNFSFISSAGQGASSPEANTGLSAGQVMNTGSSMASPTVTLSHSRTSSLSFLSNGAAPVLAAPPSPSRMSSFNFVSTSNVAPNSIPVPQSPSKASGFSFMANGSTQATPTCVPDSKIANAPPSTQRMSSFQFMDSGVSSNRAVSPPAAMPPSPSRTSSFNFISAELPQGNGVQAPTNLGVAAAGSLSPRVVPSPSRTSSFNFMANDSAPPASPMSPSRTSCFAFISSQAPPPATPAPSPTSPMSSPRGSSFRFLNPTTSAPASAPASTLPPSTGFGFTQPNDGSRLGQQAMSGAVILPTSSPGIGSPSYPKQQQQQQATPVSGFSFISS